MFRIYVLNLNAYNHGEYVGGWVHLEDVSSAEELQEAVGSEIASHGRFTDEEWMIADTEIDVAGIEIGEYTSLPTVWEMYETLSEHKNPEALGAYIDSLGSDDWRYACEQFENAYCGEWDSLEDYVNERVRDCDTGLRRDTRNFGTESVSWDDLMEFIRGAGFREPTFSEADWPDHVHHNGYVFQSV